MHSRSARPQQSLPRLIRSSFCLAWCLFQFQDTRPSLLKCETRIIPIELRACGSSTRCRFRRHRDHLFQLLIASRCAAGASGLLPDLCSRGVRTRRTLTDGAGGFLLDVPFGCCCLGILARRLDEPRRPPFECQPSCIRNAVTPSPAARAAALGGLAPRSRKTGADEAGDRVTTDPMEEYKRFLGGALGIG